MVYCHMSLSTTHKLQFTKMVHAWTVEFDADEVSDTVETETADSDDKLKCPM